MFSWMEFEAARPEMAALGQRILSKYGVAYLATVRRDGSPRVHPVCPVIVAGKLYIGVIPASPKRHDLDRDGRYVLHGLPGPSDAEFVVAGRVQPVDSAEVGRLAAIAGPSVRLSPESAMYELRMGRAESTTYERGPNSTPLPTHARWVSGEDQR